MNRRASYLLRTVAATLEGNLELTAVGPVIPFEERQSIR